MRWILTVVIAGCLVAAGVARPEVQAYRAAPNGVVPAAPGHAQFTLPSFVVPVVATLAAPPLVTHTLPPPIVRGVAALAPPTPSSRGPPLG